MVSILQDDAELLHRPPERIGRTLDGIRDAGVDWVRVTAGWSEIAPSRDAPEVPADLDYAAQGNWAALDRAVDMARSRRLGVMIDIAFFAPRWAVSRSVSPGRERWGVDPELFGAFASAVARRYADRAEGFTLWNEPNHNVFLMPQFSEGGRVAQSPHLYRRMVQASFGPVKEAAPDAVVLVGATSSIGAARPEGRASRMPPLRFLREMACVDSRLEPVRTGECRDFEAIPGDGWSHHPYGGELAPGVESPRPDDVRLADLERLIVLLRSLHARGRLANELPVWLTEYGYQTNPPDPTRRFSPAEQARFLAEAEMIARSHPEVRSTAQFLWRDLPEREGPSARVRWADYQSGLVFEDGTPKPALAAFTKPTVIRSDGTVWAMVRPGSGRRRVEVKMGGDVIAEGTTDPDGVFSGPVAEGAFSGPTTVDVVK